MRISIVLSVLVALLSISDAKKKKDKGDKEGKGGKGDKGKEFQHYQLFSTTTAYDTVRGDFTEQPECKPERIWAFIRHATRYPHIKEMDRYRKLEQLRDQILLNDAKIKTKLLKKWSFRGTNEQEMHLTQSGYEELVGLGQRLKTQFPELLNKKNIKSINLRRTSTARTTESAAAVTQGMFKKPITLPDSAIHDKLLKHGKKCAFWKKATKSDELKQQQKEFESTPRVQKIIHDVSQRLGFENDLSFAVIKDIYDVCGFETSWYHGEPSPWCIAFSTEELKLMEYYEDLTYYWKSGYGNPHTPKLGCEMIADMIARLEGSDGPETSHLYFAHSLGIREILVSLGISECRQNLTASGIEQLPIREDCWRTSFLTPFSANVIAVRYSCESGGEQESKIGIYVNEKLIKMPFCGGEELCNLEAFKKYYSSLTSKDFCNRDFCGNSERSLAADEEEEEEEFDD